MKSLFKFSKVESLVVPQKTVTVAEIHEDFLTEVDKLLAYARITKSPNLMSETTLVEYAGWVSEYLQGEYGHGFDSHFLYKQ